MRVNHVGQESLWVTVYWKHMGDDFLSTNDVVEECLCFGWIDSRPRKKDDDSFLLLVSPRKTKSVWSAVNKQKIRRLIKEKLMTIHGLKKIKEAKANGSWEALDKSDKLMIPQELKLDLEKNVKASRNFYDFPVSARRTLLEWIYSARLSSTKSRRIEKTVSMAAKGLRANVGKKP